MNKTLLILIFMVVGLCACGNKTETSQEQIAELTLNDVLTALSEAGIQYSKRAESRSAYDLQREGA
ncbi:hypothetical protein [Paenibacillus xerothermodurans]|uniref:Uncharacterized protein n=1 Tax=Paenibacillus xerothermodurans TaxID=1977292 RepID=A0A2W1NXY3_PAEXE|nr:hypothetical protein [Paenibacillus xerothermodurans]PZE19698.1 hypothetical protein CBW46_017350 [Paenibacillus xerothermodurans]